MSRNLNIPDNYINKEDRERLESFGMHTIARGRAARWRWSENMNGDDVFEIFCGGKDRTLAARIFHDRHQGIFYACDGEADTIASDTLAHVLADLERYFIRLHDELPYI